MTRRPTEAQLRKAVEVLKRPLRPTPPPKETKAELRVRIAARELAEARLREHRMAEAKWEAYEDPAVHRLRNHIVNRAVADREIRTRLRHEVPDAPPTSPARAALARSDDERRSEMVWTQYTPNGWGAPE
jgi:hypothetical protein